MDAEWGWPSAFAGSRISLAVSDVSSSARALVRTWVAIDQHKLSLVASMLSASSGTPEVAGFDNTERAIRRFTEKLGGPEGVGGLLRRALVAMTLSGCCRGPGSRAM
jgi:hypothetical protein